jgi:RNA-directed DNA polymerase
MDVAVDKASKILSQMSNIVLDELDKELSKRGHCYVRYADDIVIAVGSQKSAERVETNVTRFLEESLELKVNREKSAIRRPTELNYLGHGFLNDGTPILSKASEQRLKSKIRQLTQRKRAKGMMRFLHKLGIPKSRAWTTATSRKGWWRKSLTPASHEGMNNDWFETEEVYNLSHHYSLLHS